MQKFFIKNKKVISLIFFYSLIINLLQLVPSMYMLQVFDRIFISQNFYTLTFLTAIAIYLYIVSGLSDYFRSRVSLFISDEIDKNYLKLTQEKNKLSNNNEHELSYQDVSQLKNWLSSNSFFSLFDIFWLPFLIFIMYELHPYFGHLSIFLAIIYVVTAVGEYILTSQITSDNQNKLQENNRETHNFIRHHELLSTSGYYSQYFESWKQKFTLSNLKIRDNLRTVDLLGALLQALRQITPSITIFLGAFLVINHDFSMPVMIVASILISRVTAPIDAVLKNIEKIPHLIGIFNNLQLDLEKIIEKNNFSEEELEIESIRLKNISVDIENKVVLKNFDASFEAGHIYNISGVRGSGKSLILKILAGQFTDYTGTIFANGNEIKSTNSILPSISYLDNSINLFPANIIDNITCYEESPNTEQVYLSAKASNAHTFIVKLSDGYNTMIGDGYRSLSIGQTKRILISQVLYSNRRIILLDQPETHLDDMSTRILANHLREIKKNKIIIFTGGDNHLLKICDVKINLETN